MFKKLYHFWSLFRTTLESNCSYESDWLRSFLTVILWPLKGITVFIWNCFEYYFFQTFFTINRWVSNRSQYFIFSYSIKQTCQEMVDAILSVKDRLLKKLDETKNIREKHFNDQVKYLICLQVGRCWNLFSIITFEWMKFCGFFSYGMI